MKVYVSASCPWAARHVADVLREWGHTVVSTWHDDLDRLDSCYAKTKAADRNQSQIYDAQALVLVASHDKVPGAKFVEVGIALGRGHVVIVIGHRENMMLFAEEVKAVDTPHMAAAKIPGGLPPRAPDINIRRLLAEGADG